MRQKLGCLMTCRNASRKQSRKRDLKDDINSPSPSPSSPYPPSPFIFRRKLRNSPKSAAGYLAANDIKYFHAFVLGSMT
jgi:hypothetical protein